MSEVIELVYASRATFTPVGGGGVEPEVARILAQSRRNNPRHDVGGVLCYRDGHFFQCLEGAPAEVDTVYRRIAADPRHSDVKVLSHRPIGARRFRTWSMKYLAADDGIRRLLQDNGLSTFDPYRFDNRMVLQLVSFLHDAVDPPVGGGRPADRADLRNTGTSTQRLAMAALGVAMAALAVASIALYRGFG